MMTVTKPWWLVLLPYVAFVVLLGFMFGIGYDLAERRYSAELDAEQARHTAELSALRADLEGKRADAEHRAREAERKSIADMAELSADFHERERRAEQRAAQLRAAVNAGELRLRERFTCPAGPGATHRQG